ncbi:hypothetical protein QWW56_10255 [Neisseria gonorrhoeae]
MPDCRLGFPWSFCIPWIFDLRAKPAIIPFEIKRYRLCAGLLIAFVYELAPAVLPIRGCLFFLVFVF